MRSIKCIVLATAYPQILGAVLLDGRSRTERCRRNVDWAWAKASQARSLCTDRGHQLIQCGLDIQVEIEALSSLGRLASIVWTMGT
jgi:hypothetical protein